MKKLIRLFALGLLLSMNTFAQNDVEYSKSLKKLFEATGTEATYQTAIKEMFGMFKSQYPDVKEDVWKDMEKEFLNTSLDDLVEMLVPVYKAELSKSEIDEVTKFYLSPAGKKYASKTPVIMEESMKVGEAWGRKIGERFAKKLEEKGSK